ncbi:unnamed protein product, partial [Meganyctiphanes norvegica]
MTNTFDDLLTRLGTGRWSWLYIFLVGYNWLWKSTHINNGAFIASHVDYTCISSTNNTELSRDSCFYYTNTSSNNSQEHTCISWIYDDSPFASTLTSEFNLVCDNAYFRAYYTSAYMIGTMIGNPLAGMLGDRIGRRKVAMAASLVYCIISILIVVLPSLNGIIMARFFIGLADVTTFYTLMMEVCEPKWRGILGIASGIAWAIGTMVLGGTGYLIRNWRDMQLALAIPTLLIPVFVWCINTSKILQIISVERFFDVPVFFKVTIHVPVFLRSPYIPTVVNGYLILSPIIFAPGHHTISGESSNRATSLVYVLSSVTSLVNTLSVTLTGECILILTLTG